MCLIAFAYKNHPRYDLILAANRDEFYERPTRPAQFWEDHPNLLAGKDLTAGGSWMGVNRRGQFAALTNYRDPSISRGNPPSRGNIVLNYLTHKKSARAYLQHLHEQSERYMGFNVLTGTADRLLHYSNQQQKINRVEPGIHGLSNHLLDTPWPKVVQAKNDLQSLLNYDQFPEEGLFDLLTNDQEAPDEQLPETGITKEMEKKISPVFIKTDGYGTRSSTILLIDKNGLVTFEERRFKNGSQQVDDINRFEFEIEQ